MVTSEEKDSFLALLRAGKDPAHAAQIVNPEYSGSTFRRLTNEGNKNYDAVFAADYLRARAEGRQKRELSPSAVPRTTTLNGFVKAAYLSEEMLEQFLEEIANGTPMVEAAAKVEPRTSLSQLNRRAHRDKAFADAFAAAREVGYPIFKERLRSEAVRQAFAGDYRALRDQLLIHDEEFRRILLTQKHEIGGVDGEAIKVLAAKALPELPTEKIEELIAYMEQKQLTPAVEDAA